jgi:NAD+ synthase
MTAGFHRVVLALDPAAETERIVSFIRRSVQEVCKKRGAVVGVSGGVDSAVTLALCARALGPERVIGLLMQERESSPDNAVLARATARACDVVLLAEEITAALEGLGCYRRRDAAIGRVFPEYDSTYRAKITLPGDMLERDLLNLFALTVISPRASSRRGACRSPNTVRSSRPPTSSSARAWRCSIITPNSAAMP